MQDLPHQHDFDDAMRQQVDRRKQQRTGAQTLGAVQDVGRDEVAGILRELGLCQGRNEVVQIAGLDAQQQDAAGDLQQSAVALDEDANLKGIVEPAY